MKRLISIIVKTLIFGILFWIVLNVLPFLTVFPDIKVILSSIVTALIAVGLILLILKLPSPSEVKEFIKMLLSKSRL